MIKAKAKGKATVTVLANKKKAAECKLTVYADESEFLATKKITMEAEKDEISMKAKSKIAMETKDGDVEVKKDVIADSQGDKISLMKHKHTAPNGDTGPAHM